MSLRRVSVLTKACCSGSKFHLMRKHGILKQLRTLDLSDNDIYDLRAVLIALSPLQFLRGLLLEGNPCSVCQSYKNITLKHLPQLEYLDNTQILEEDRPPPEENCEENCTEAAIIFTCHRIIGLPPPPKEKGIQQTIHLEVSLPLLEEIEIEPPVSEVDLEEELETKGLGVRGKKEKSEKSKSKKGDKSMASSKRKGNPYAGEDEHQREMKAKIKDTSFKTARMPWSKVIQFPEDTLVVESPHYDLKDIRDTFRSCVDIKVVYLKILPPMKPKKGKTSKMKKEKKKDKGKKGKSSEPAPKEVVEPKETILKKITLANFSCDLQAVNWSDKTVDFYWAAHPKTTPKAAVINGDLRALKYIEGKSKGKNKGKAKSETELKKVSSKAILPTIFTCQVGFGLRRL